MRRIRKRAEAPLALQDAERDGTGYDDVPKDAIRRALVEDQRGLCCYCMQRIHPDVERMKIEHRQSQEEHAHLALRWSNLFGACKGGEGKRPRDQHCDTKKGSRAITLDVLRTDHAGLFSYSRDGTLRVEGEGPLADALRADVDHTLNLNLERLRRNRKEKVETVLAHLLSAHGGTLTKKALSDALTRYDNDEHHELDEFAGAVAYWIRKRLRRFA